jgi:hypothetical protein
VSTLASQGERQGACCLRRPLPGRRTNSCVTSLASLCVLSMSDAVSTRSRYRSWNA